jgi:hypothetical protein
MDNALEARVIEPLNPDKIEYYALRYTELECYFKIVYGHEYEIPPGEEFGPGSLKRNIKPEQLDKYDTEILNKFKNTGKGHYLLTLLMTDCCNMGLLPAGKYIIDVTW